MLFIEDSLNFSSILDQFQPLNIQTTKQFNTYFPRKKTRTKIVYFTLLLHLLYILSVNMKIDRSICIFRVMGPIIGHHFRTD